MSKLETALKSRHCGGCRQTVDLGYVGGGEARCPVCGRAFSVAPEVLPTDPEWIDRRFESKAA